MSYLQRVVYINPGGSDTNLGDVPTSPMLTLQAAAKRLKGNGEIRAAVGDYINNGLDASTTKDIKIKGFLSYYGAARFFYGEKKNVFTADGSDWKTTITTVIPANITSAPRNYQWVFDWDAPEASTVINQVDILPLQRNRPYRVMHARLEQVSTRGAMTAGTFFYDSGTSTLYIRRYDSSNPNGHDFWIPSQTSAANKQLVYNGNGDNRVEIENIEVYFAYTGIDFSYTNTAITKNVTAYGCSFNGVWHRYTDFSQEWNNEYAACGADGGDYTGIENVTPSINASLFHKHFSFNVWAHDCGDQGQSWHQKTAVYCYGGLSENNKTGGYLGGIGPATFYNCVTRNNAIAGFFTGIGTPVSPENPYFSMECIDCSSLNDEVGFGVGSLGNGHLIVRGGIIISPTTAAFRVDTGSVLDAYGVDIPLNTTISTGSGTLNNIVSAVRLRSITTPATLSNGDVWYDGTHMYGRVNGVTAQIDNNPSGTAYVEVTGNTTMVANTIYYTNSASLITLTLPATFNQNDIFGIVGKGAGGWTVAQASGQTTRLTSVSTTTGTGGSVSSSNRYDNMILRGLTANTELSATTRNGSLIVV